MIRNILKSGVVQFNKNGLRNMSVVKTTIDSNELEHFTKLSEMWWDKDAPTRVLQQLNEIRVPYVKDILIADGLVTKEAALTKKPFSGLTILDAGCGGGFLSEAIARLGAKTTGLDATKQLIEVAKIHMQLDKDLANNLNYCHTFIEEFARSSEGKFDAVVSSEVIEHIEAKKDFIDAFVKCAKPGGTVIMTTIAQTWRAYVEAIILGEWVFYSIPKGTHEYDKLITAQDLQQLLEESGCTIKGIRGFSYRPFKKHWDWTKHPTVHYAIHAVKNK